MASLILVATIAALSGSAIADSPLGYDWVSNPGAENGDNAGWASTGWAARRYADTEVRVSPGDADYVGNWLYTSASDGASMTQTVSLADVAQSIDAGTQPIGVSAYLGGTGTSTSSAEVTVRFLDAASSSIGEAVQLGPPSATDRYDETSVLLCRTRVLAPIGARTAIVSLHAMGGTSGAQPAFADEISITNDLVQSGVGTPPTVAADGANCLKYARSTPTPSPSPTVAPYPSPTATSDPGPGVHFSHVRLRARHLSFQLSGASRVRVTLERHRRVRRSSTSWTRVRQFTATAANGAVFRSFTPLAPGRYRIRFHASRTSADYFFTLAKRNDSAARHQ